MSTFCSAFAYAIELSERTFAAIAALIGAATFALISDIAARSGSSTPASAFSSSCVSVLYSSSAICVLLQVALVDRCLLRRIGGGGRAVRKHIRREREIDRYGDVRVDQGHRCTLRQLFTGERVELFARQLFVLLCHLSSLSRACDRHRPLDALVADDPVDRRSDGCGPRRPDQRRHRLAARKRLRVLSPQLFLGERGTLLRRSWTSLGRPLKLARAFHRHLLRVVRVRRTVVGALTEAHASASNVGGGRATAGAARSEARLRLLRCTRLRDTWIVDLLRGVLGSRSIPSRNVPAYAPKGGS